MFITSVTTEPPPDAATANLGYLLARAFQQPDTFSGDEPRLLREALSASEKELEPEGTELGRQWEHALSEDRTLLMRDYARLFLGPFEILAAPYASFYLDPEKQLMGEVSQEVARRYAEAGLAPREDEPSDAPDYIVNECEFLYYLAHQYLSTEDAAEAGEWNRRYGTFARGHFAQWVPPFCEAILAVDPLHPFYPALARFGRLFAKQIQS